MLKNISIVVGIISIVFVLLFALCGGFAVDKDYYIKSVSTTYERVYIVCQNRKYAEDRILYLAQNFDDANRVFKDLKSLK